MHRLPTDLQPLLATTGADSISPWLISVVVHLLIAIGGSLWLLDLKTHETPEIVVLLRQANPAEELSGVFLAPLVATIQPPDPLYLLAADPPVLASSGPAQPSLARPLLQPISQPAQTVTSTSAPADAPIGRQPTVKSRRVFLPTDPRDVAAILAEDALIPREIVPTGPTASLPLFGSSAVGRSFVFAIDRSASMGSGGLNATAATARELALRMGHLTGEQRFQIVAYNESVEYLTSRELIPATKENQQRLVEFMGSLPAFGQTEHLRGLLAALRLKPEVIFLLTDGGDPVLHPGQLQMIRHEAAGRTCIHCVRFGRGPESEPLGFLARLAAENRGSYVYLDVNAP
jgi:von Willebrand factor type A domain